MIQIPNELTTIISLMNNGMIWVYILIFVVLSYLFISLITWSFIKPLKYLSIPTIFAGIIFLTIRLSSSLILNFIKVETGFNLIDTIFPSILRPILINGIICLITGIAMLITYIFITNNNKNKQINI